MLPDLLPDPTQEEIEEAAELREARELERHAQTGNRKVLLKLSVGDGVKVWNSTSKKFDREWKVVAARESAKDYARVTSSWPLKWGAQGCGGLALLKEVSVFSSLCFLSDRGV